MVYTEVIHLHPFKTGNGLNEYIFHIRFSHSPNLPVVQLILSPGNVLLSRSVSVRKKRHLTLYSAFFFSSGVFLHL